MHFNGYFAKTNFLMLFQFTARRKKFAFLKASAFIKGAGILFHH